MNFLTVFKMSSFLTVTPQTHSQTSLPRKNQETPPGHYLINNKSNLKQKTAYSNK